MLPLGGIISNVEEVRLCTLLCCATLCFDVHKDSDVSGSADAMLADKLSCTYHAFHPCSCSQ